MQLSTDGGLGTTDKFSDILLILPDSDQNHDLITLGMGKMGHTVWGKGISANSPYRTKGRC
jgi:hypothetical protein